MTEPRLPIRLSQDEYEQTTVIYSYGERILMVVEDCFTWAGHGDWVRINNHRYQVYSVELEHLGDGSETRVICHLKLNGQEWPEVPKWSKTMVMSTPVPLPPFKGVRDGSPAA